MQSEELMDEFWKGLINSLLPAILVLLAAICAQLLAGRNLGKQLKHNERMLMKQWEKSYREQQIRPIKEYILGWLQDPRKYIEKTPTSDPFDLSAPRGAIEAIPDEKIHQLSKDFLSHHHNYFYTPMQGAREETYNKAAEVARRLAREFERYLKEI
jgi:hypothetical protein